MNLSQASFPAKNAARACATLSFRGRIFTRQELELMREIAKNRTVLIIAHRLSAVRHADRILTIERGRLVEDGSHDELLRAGGRYASLLRLQSGLHGVA